jgi:hypothetical protein
MRAKSAGVPIGIADRELRLFEKLTFSPEFPVPPGATSVIAGFRAERYIFPPTIRAFPDIRLIAPEIKRNLDILSDYQYSIRSPWRMRFCPVGDLRIRAGNDARKQ